METSQIYLRLKANNIYFFLNEKKKNIREEWFFKQLLIFFGQGLNFLLIKLTRV